MRIFYLPAAAAAFSIAAPGMAQPPTVPEQFNSASVALNAERWDEALRAFESLERRVGNPRTLGIVRVRKAEALLRLRRIEEASEALKLGLPALPANDPTLRQDRYLGMLTLGKINEHLLDYGEAFRNYGLAESLAQSPQEKVDAIRGLIETGMFHDTGTALANADRALALIAGSPDIKALEPGFGTLKGRVLLNLQRFGEARKELGKANAALGGLTMKVDAADIATRSDLAIAAILDGDTKEAQRYLAYTGAGRFEDAFALGAEMVPPACGEEGNLKPEDVAIVEFAIREDGSIAGVSPIYSSREGDSALAFARAVSGWSWTPEEAKKIPALFRLLTRVELRCTNSSTRPSVRQILWEDSKQWLEERGVQEAATPEISDARRLDPLVKELAAREAKHGPRSVHLLPVLSELAENAVTSAEDRQRYVRQALEIARAEKAPAAAITFFALAEATLQWAMKSKNWKSVPKFQALHSDPLIAADPRAAAAVRLEEAEYTHRNASKKQQAIQLLNGVRDMPGLGENDPIRAAALVRLASLQLAAGEKEAAQATFRLSGLSGDQCALLDSPPKLRAGSFSSNDFPQEALRWGFEGWAQVETDIAADGATANVRPVIAYPPFVFGKAAAAMMDRARFEPSFRPGGALGCGAYRQRISFRMP